MARRANTYIKTRKFLLKPKAGPKLTTFPRTLQRIIQLAQQKWRSDPAYCVQCLTDEAFVQQMVLASKANQLTSEQLTHGIQAIQGMARKHLFHELYPQQFLQLYARMGALFEQLSQENPDAFQATSLPQIKASILNANDPWLQEQKNQQVQSKNLSAKTSLWAPFRAFTFTDEEFTFRSRTLWAAAINQYFAYRNNLIRDATLHLLTGYLTNSTIVSRKELIHFFQTECFSRNLVQSLFQRLTKDLTDQFPGWEGVHPTWALYLNALRQIRNRACESLDNTLIASTLQTYLETASRKIYTQAILTSFKAEAEKRGKALPEYWVDGLMRKLKRPLRQQFKSVWDHFFRQRANPQSLTGVKRFIYEFLTQFVQTIPNYPQYTHNQIWEILQAPHRKQNCLIQQLEKTRPLFEDLIDQINFRQVAHQSIKAIIE
ncbi:MAG: hypothetical protein ACXAEI_10240, partial [Candidatus Hodarchaeales archaeon]